METRRVLSIPSLDGIRAISIGLVFADHVGMDFIPGGFGVTVFFVLSGYLISTLLRLEYERTDRISLRHFYLRRVFRIWPALYAVLVIAAVVTALFGLGAGKVDSLPLLAQFGHFWNYFSIFYRGHQLAMAGTGILWSLAVEEHFYFVLPILVVIMCRFRMAFRQQAIALVSLAVLVVIWRCHLVYQLHQSSDLRTYYATDTRVDSLFLGCALAFFGNPMLDRVSLNSKVLRTHAFLGLLAILASLTYRDFRFREGFRYTIQAAGVLFIIRYLIASPASPLGRLMNSPLMVRIGQLSYPFYLLHYIVIIEIQKHIEGQTTLGRIEVAAVAAPISLALAWALQRWLMDPATRFRQRVVDARVTSSHSGVSAST